MKRKTSINLILGASILIAIGLIISLIFTFAQKQDFKISTISEDTYSKIIIKTQEASSYEIYKNYCSDCCEKPKPIWTQEEENNNEPNIE
ncbi:MAG: hypothetical protein WC812_00915 [Candidatus Pacearchaeota archaeon]|jgi:hypothetical protein